MRIRKLFSRLWVDLYVGKDADRYQVIKEKLDTNEIRYRAKEYNAVSRIAMQSLGTPAVPFSRGPTVTPYKLQANLLSQKKLDSYSIEVQKKDLTRAQKCLSTSCA